MAFDRGEGGSQTGSASIVDTPVSIQQGGTGATTAAQARTNLGLGTIATQASGSVSITGGSITDITDLAVADGGTGASTAAGALVNLLPSYTGNANKALVLNGTATGVEWSSVATGDVVGPASSTDGNVVLFDGSTGKLIKSGGALGTAAFSNTSAFATAAQGTKADTALQPADIGSTVQGYDVNTAKYNATTANFTGTLQKSGSNVLTASDIGSSVQGYDGDLNAIAAIAGTSGLLKKTAANTWSLDTNTYLTSETDPVYVASSWYSTTNNASNWNTAYGWGNHATAGYAADSAVVKLTGNQTVAGVKTFSSTITGDISGNAGTVTNGVYTSGSYANPSWITSLAETKVLPSQTGNSGKYLTTDGTSTSWATVTGGGGGSGDVVGPASATDNAVVRFDGTTGKLIQNSAVTIADTTGDITGGKFNKVTITTPATGSTLTIADGKTLTASNTLTFTGTDSSSVAFGGGGTVAYTSNNLSAFASTTSAQLAGVISDETGTGSLVFATSPSLTTPSLGVASATSINKVTITTPGTGSTLTIADGKTLTASNSLTLAGTDATTMTFPSSSTTVVGTDSTQTLTNKRVTPRVSTTASSATPTINTDNVDIYGLTAQTVDITSFTTNLSGTPTDGQKLQIYIVGTAARAITWGASFESSTITLPTTTVSTNRLDVGFIWNAATSKWRCVATA